MAAGTRRNQQPSGDPAATNVPRPAPRTRQHADGGRLAGAVVAQQRGDLAARDVQGQAIHSNLQCSVQGVPRSAGRASVAGLHRRTISRSGLL